MKTNEIAIKHNIPVDSLNAYIKVAGVPHRESFTGAIILDDGCDVKAIVDGYLAIQQKREDQKVQIEEEAKRRREESERKEAEMRVELPKILITSGFSFEGYKITKYSGYISGDAVTQVDRGLNFLIGGGTNTGNALSDALVDIRRIALLKLKEAAYDLGCNAIIGVDFDYITLEPETANITGGTTYMPYVFCVTANGNAVTIEKDE